jgi:hypothetical protein
MLMLFKPWSNPRDLISGIDAPNIEHALKTILFIPPLIPPGIPGFRGFRGGIHTNSGEESAGIPEFRDSGGMQEGIRLQFI